MADRLKNGDWNAICGVCGFKYKASELKRRWDNLMVCPEDFEHRHPQDFLKSKRDDQAVPWSRPEQADVFVALSQPSITGPTTEVVVGSQYLNSTGIWPYTWTISDGSIDSTTGIITAKGATTAEVTITDAEGQTDTLSITFEVTRDCTIPITEPFATIDPVWWTTTLINGASAPTIDAGRVKFDTAVGVVQLISNIVLSGDFDISVDFELDAGTPNMFLIAWSQSPNDLTTFANFEVGPQYGSSIIGKITYPTPTGWTDYADTPSVTSGTLRMTRSTTTLRAYLGAVEIGTAQAADIGDLYSPMLFFGAPGQASGWFDNFVITSGTVTSCPV